MIHKYKNVLHYLYVMYSLYLDTTHTTALQQFWVPVGGRVTLMDYNTNHYKTKTWYFYYYQCYSASQSQNGFCKLCEVLYPKTSHVNHKLFYGYTNIFNYTCNTTTLHIYNITTQTPTTYKLVKEYYQQTQKTTYYHLNITSTTTKTTRITQTTPITNTLRYTYSFTLLPTKGPLKASSSIYTIPIIATGVLGVICAGFGYLYYHKRKTM
ncbi:membrane protein RL11B [Cercopithecine betaherpesvirus 5]|uniref:Membrane protein RL11B n=1 Tax=Simian cytomegalovirus (strain Colburn) TaxID=50292 RepID=G8XT64_SCMVC|nr:membrane protein RL11B [Cercopithecine betaherpesvirus 5]AEV80356.1 membrane protein RL11B [Cercopithecine betaherpesvirus 5]